MRHVLLLSIAASSLLACGYGREAQTTTITGAPMITSGPGAGERELSRTLDALSGRMAEEVCRHEVKCGRVNVATCREATMKRARDELGSWSCSPAETRAQLEQCLATIDEESCEVDLSAKGSHFCRATPRCATRGVAGSPGGAAGAGGALADRGR